MAIGLSTSLAALNVGIAEDSNSSQPASTEATPSSLSQGKSQLRFRDARRGWTDGEQAKIEPPIRLIPPATSAEEPLPAGDSEFEQQVGVEANAETRQTPSPTQVVPSRSPQALTPLNARIGTIKRSWESDTPQTLVPEATQHVAAPVPLQTPPAPVAARQPLFASPHAKLDSPRVGIPTPGVSPNVPDGWHARGHWPQVPVAQPAKGRNGLWGPPTTLPGGAWQYPSTPNAMAAPESDDEPSSWGSPMDVRSKAVELLAPDLVPRAADLARPETNLGAIDTPIGSGLAQPSDARPITQRPPTVSPGQPSSAVDPLPMLPPANPVASTPSGEPPSSQQDQLAPETRFHEDSPKGKQTSSEANDDPDLSTTPEHELPLLPSRGPSEKQPDDQGSDSTKSKPPISSRRTTAEPGANSDSPSDTTGSESVNAGNAGPALTDEDESLWRTWRDSFSVNDAADDPSPGGESDAPGVASKELDLESAARDAWTVVESDRNQAESNGNLKAIDSESLQKLRRLDEAEGSDPSDNGVDSRPIDNAAPKVDPAPHGRDWTGRAKLHAGPGALRSVPSYVARLRTPISQTLRYYHQNAERADSRSNWGMMHAIMVYRGDTRLIARGRQYNAVAWLAGNNVCRGKRLMTSNKGQLEVREGVGLQGHQAQFLAVMAMAGVPSNYPLYVGRQRFSIQDLVKNEASACRDDAELTFTLIGLSYYLDTDTTWVGADKEAWDFQRLIASELDQPVVGAACGGTHRLMSFAHALRKRRLEGNAVDGQWLRAERYLDDFVDYTYRLQNRDGSMSTKWFEGPEDNGDLDRKVQTTGHMVEFLLTHLPDEKLNDPRLLRSITFLLNSMSQNTDREWSIGPKGHALRSLALYQKRIFNVDPVTNTRPSTAKRRTSRR
ncbi:MAG: hypothetical protein AAGD07_17105 [Planctomycetota bacterium]